MKKVTIYEVAKEAHVSLATVSRVINGSNVVKEDTKKRVEDAITKLGYRPNAIAQGLALSRTTTVGLIIPSTSVSFFGRVINGLCDVAKIYDYSVFLHTITEGVTDIKEIIDEVIKSRVDGVIIYADKDLDDSVKLLEEYSIPMVVIGNKISSENICSVYVDYERAVYELCDAYLEKGITDIAILQDYRNDLVSSFMHKGAEDAFRKHNLDYNGFVAVSRDNRSTYKFLKSYFKNHKHQVFIANRDSQALAALNAATGHGIAIPEEMELVCMNESKYTSSVRPEISSFIVPSYDLGAISMRLMTKMLKDENVEEKEKCLDILYSPKDTTRQ
ncbi:MAG: LacI family DNA-binding transcriptional regulator [Erysipelotrichaceae bacterium]|nr:LacI family DNA-binding transcriptional regulator [Erysipelotrichaceae bacterium]